MARAAGDGTAGVDRPATTPLAIDTTRTAEAARLTLDGELDVLTAPRFLREVESAMRRVTERVEVDASGLRFVDSAGLRAIVTAWQRSMQLGLEVRVVDPSPELLRILELTGLRHLLGETA